VLIVDLYAPGEEPTPLSGVMERGGALEFEEKLGPHPGGGNSLQPVPSLSPTAIDAAVLDHSGIRIQVPDGAGGWRALEHRYPREHMDEAMVLPGGYSKLRLEFVGRHGLGFVGWVAPIGRVIGTEQALRSARHASLGDVAEPLAGIDAQTIALRPRDDIELRFEASPIAAGQVRDYFLLTHGVYTALAMTPDLAAGSVPPRFALHQNRPNPFAGTTTIGFDLPVGCQVRLEIFDLQGRRVKELVNAGFAPGRHVAEWDHRTDQGGAARAGVYLYRITAGSFRAQRTMTMLP